MDQLEFFELETSLRHVENVLAHLVLELLSLCLDGLSDPFIHSLASQVEPWVWSARSRS